MSPAALCPQLTWWSRHRPRKSPDRPASRPRTTAAWARDTRRKSKRPAPPAPDAPDAEQASNKPLRTITPQCEVSTPHSAVRTPQLKVLWPYVGAAAAVFALALNVRTVLAVFMSAVEVLR